MSRNGFNFLQQAWELVRPFWLSSERKKAVLYLTLTLIFVLLEVYAAVGINKWNSSFYNSLQSYNQPAFFSLLLEYSYLLVFYVLTMLLSYYFSSLLEIMWRKWLTHFYLHEWFSSKAYYKARFNADPLDNPDQRISEDIHLFIQTTLTLLMGIFRSLITLASFTVILWGLSGNFKFSLAGWSFVIPGYLVWAVIVYSLSGTYLTFKIGRQLISLSYKQQRYEADFRYSLIRVREYAEHILSYAGADVEKQITLRHFDNIIHNFMASVKRNLKLNTFNFAYAQLSNIVPTLIVAGHYFAHQITLGSLMQTTSAFMRIEFAITYLIFAYPLLATWQATSSRLQGFKSALLNSAKLKELTVTSPQADYLQLKNLQIQLPNGKILVDNFSLSLAKGERLLLQGASGSGKTSLLKVINGLWPYASGEVIQQESLTSLFIAQKAYLPLVNLKEAICYPRAKNLPNDDDVRKIMQDCGLTNLIDRLYELHDWGNYLSLGEQQKIGFCRLLINKPDIIYLDEATSALDPAAEEMLYQLLFECLADSAVLSVAHRSELRRLHSKILLLG